MPFSASCRDGGSKPSLEKCSKSWVGRK
jgi:hypothetical protein